MSETSARGLSGDEFDGPEEFQWDDAKTHTSATGSYALVLDLMRRGNQAFREKRYEEAISCYSKAQLSKPGDPVILSNRSAAFCRISQLLKERSATASENQPLNGLDPTTHAELALKDADKVLSIQGDFIRPYLLKAKALVSLPFVAHAMAECQGLLAEHLTRFDCPVTRWTSKRVIWKLERYDEAREVLLMGLQIDPLSPLIKNSLLEFDKVMSDPAKMIKQWKPQRTDDFECTLCLKLLFEPITTPCGHSFCRSCLLQSMDHGNKCPMCRMVLLIRPRTYPVSVTLHNIIQKNFPEEYAERKLELVNLTYVGLDILPLFVMDVVLPCQKLSLNIFEPRYRLMVRRIMEGNHRMGMVILDSATGAIADFACEVEILECEPLPDGRFYLEVEGRRRFQIKRSWDQDGYRVAEVEWVQDVHLSEGSQEKKDLLTMASEASERAQTWIRNAREAAGSGRRARRWDVLQAEGMPRVHDPEKFSFWFVNLLSLRPSERLILLRLRDTRERISYGLDVLQRTEEQGCQVQ